MNVTFKLKGGEALEKKFITEASEKGIKGVGGHRSVGGQLYNVLRGSGDTELTLRFCRYSHLHLQRRDLRAGRATRSLHEGLPGSQLEMVNRLACQHNKTYLPTIPPPSVPKVDLPHSRLLGPRLPLLTCVALLSLSCFVLALVAACQMSRFLQSFLWALVCTSSLSAAASPPPSPLTPAAPSSGAERQRLSKRDGEKAVFAHIVQVSLRRSRMASTLHARPSRPTPTSPSGDLGRRSNPVSSLEHAHIGCIPKLRAARLRRRHGSRRHRRHQRVRPQCWSRYDRRRANGESFRCS